jgi:transcriptional regulatory protein LevR
MSCNSLTYLVSRSSSLTLEDVVPQVKKVKKKVNSEGFLVIYDMSSLQSLEMVINTFTFNSLRN